MINILIYISAFIFILLFVMLFIKFKIKVTAGYIDKNLNIKLEVYWFSALLKLGGEYAGDELKLKGTLFYIPFSYNISSKKAKSEVDNIPENTDSDSSKSETKSNTKSKRSSTKSIKSFYSKFLEWKRYYLTHKRTIHQIFQKSKTYIFIILKKHITFQIRHVSGKIGLDNPYETHKIESYYMIFLPLLNAKSKLKSDLKFDYSKEIINLQISIFFSMKIYAILITLYHVWRDSKKFMKDLRADYD